MSQPGAVPTPTSRPSDAAAALAPRAANNRARRTNHSAGAARQPAPALAPGPSLGRLGASLGAAAGR